MIDWSKFTPREIRDALRTAPIVLTAWREITLTGSFTYARCRTLDDVEGRCDLGAPYAWVRLDRGGLTWAWTVEDMHKRAPTLRQAQGAADEALRALGYVLDDDTNGVVEAKTRAPVKRLVLRSLSDPNLYMQDVDEGRAAAVWGPLDTAYDYSRDQKEVPKLDAEEHHGELYDVYETGPVEAPTWEVAGKHLDGSETA
jgi:hypothetical protein